MFQDIHICVEMSVYLLLKNDCALDIWLVIQHLAEDEGTVHF
jgi:hypothetical protein